MLWYLYLIPSLTRYFKIDHYFLTNISQNTLTDKKPFISCFRIVQSKPQSPMFQAFLKNNKIKTEFGKPLPKTRALEEFGKPLPKTRALEEFGKRAKVHKKTDLASNPENFVGTLQSMVMHDLSLGQASR